MDNPVVMPVVTEDEDPAVAVAEDEGDAQVAAIPPLDATV